MKTESEKYGYCEPIVLALHFQLCKRGLSVIHIPSSIEGY